MTVAEKQRTSRPAPPGARRGRRGTGPPWWFALPALVLFAFVVLVPSGRGVYYALTDWDGLSPDWAFVGLDNFIAMLDDPTALQAIWHTLLIAIAITVIQNGCGLLLALGVNSLIKSRNVLRVFLFAPAVVTPIVTAYLWRNLLGPDGAVNSLLAAVGLGSWQQDWLGDPQLALISVIAIHTWQWTPFAFLVLLATLSTLPPDVYEAARLDRAGAWQRFFHLTLPLIRPAVVMVVILRTMTALSAFAAIFAATGGGPGSATEILNLYAYRTSFSELNLGYGAALAIVLMSITLVISYFMFRLRRRRA